MSVDVYLVGSWGSGSAHRNVFVVERIYTTLEEAIEYRKSRVNDKYKWVVFKARSGQMFIEWECIKENECDQH